MSILKAIEEREKSLEAQIAYWKKEAAYWEDKYNESVMQSIKHSETMMANILGMALNKTK